MKTTTIWKEKMLFESSDGQVSSFQDSKPPLGTGKALTPKQLALSAVAGCSAMDVISLLRKHKQNVVSFKIDADAPISEGYPATFTKVDLDYHLEGEIDKEKAIEAVHLSQTKYCGVSAMMAKHCPIHYRIFLNGNAIHEGTSQF